VQLEGLGKMEKKKKEKKTTSLGLDPRPSGLKHSASTNFATAYPFLSGTALIFI
jgi:hypothetical protein